ncbi:MAG: tail fiber domain-containing protein [Flavobacteriaceae bacterium]
MKKAVFLIILISTISLSQVGIGTTSPNASSALDITSSNSGILIPRMTEAQRDAISSPATGLLIYQTDNSFGFYYFDGVWRPIGGNTIEKINDLTDGKSDNDGSQNGSSIFLGIDSGAQDDSSDNRNVGIGYQSLSILTSGYHNVGVGYQTLQNTINGDGNVALGYQCLQNNIANGNIAIGYQTLIANVSGDSNVAMGSGALQANQTGDRNIAIGNYVLNGTTGASDNIAIGYRVLGGTTSSGNIGIGRDVMYAQTSGFHNIGIGRQVLMSNQTGYFNTAIGYRSMYDMTGGNDNVGVGKYTLEHNSGDENTAIGNTALFFNTTGTGNTALGRRAMNENTTGSFNTAIGMDALSSTNMGNMNTSIGYNSGTTGNYNTLVGAAVGAGSGDNNIIIGYDSDLSSSSVSNEIRMGNTSITSARIQVPWTITSDKRWKEDIRELSYGTDFISKLRPVDYLRKNDDRKLREAGFIAQDIAQVIEELGLNNMGMLSQDENGNYELRYNDFIPIVVKAIQEQKEEIETLKSRLLKIEKMLN